MFKQEHDRTQQQRRGAAATELAVLLPLIFVLVFGSMEACNVIHLRQALTSVAYEGGIAAGKPGATQSTVEARMGGLLTALKTSGATATVTGDGQAFDDTPPGGAVEVTVAAPIQSNLAGVRLFSTNGTMSVTILSLKH